MAKLLLKGWRALRDAFSPSAFKKRMQTEIGKATALNALLAEGAIKAGIASGKGMAKNSKFTIALKGSSRPLVASGELLKSIIGRKIRWDYAVAGVLKSRAVRDKSTGQTNDVLNIAQILHGGATIHVSDKMRRFFFWMASRYEKGEIKEPWKPLSRRTKVIVIPPRPFLEFATEQKMLDKYADNWAAAVQRAMVGGVR